MKTILIEGWKTLRWKELIPHDDGVDSVFKIDAMDALIERTLQENGHTEADLFNVQITYPPEHTKRDLGSVDIWLFIKDKK